MSPVGTGCRLAEIAFEPLDKLGDGTVALTVVAVTFVLPPHARVPPLPPPWWQLTLMNRTIREQI